MQKAKWCHEEQGDNKASKEDEDNRREEIKAKWRRDKHDHNKKRTRDNKNDYDKRLKDAGVYAIRCHDTTRETSKGKERHNAKAIRKKLKMPPTEKKIGTKEVKWRG